MLAQGAMAAFGGSDGSSSQGAATAQGPDMEWDLDVDAFLDDYLKELGPEAHGPDHFGNISIDFGPPTTAAPGMLGAWGPSAAPASSIPVDSAVQQPTMLTGQLQAQGLASSGQAGDSGLLGTAAAAQAAAAAAAAAAGASSPHQQQQASPRQATSARTTRARKSAAGVAAATAAAAAVAGAPSGGGRAAGGARGGGKETKKELDMKKHLALQEKNRRAQRRFRERQKQRVAELEEQVASLQAQLAAASAAGKAGAAGAPPPLPMPLPMVPPPAGSAGAAPVRLPSEGDFMQQDQDAKKEVNASPRAVVGAPSTSSPPASDEDGPVLPAVAFDDALTLTVREGAPVQLSARELADLTPAELAKHYKAYVNELAGILVESDNPASQATQDRVRRLVDEVCLLSTRSALCNPAGSKHFALTKVDDVPGQPADARVPQIARALDISAAQRKQLGQLRGLFLQKLGRIAADRRDINSHLQGAVPGGTGNRALCSRYLGAHDAARRLRESLREEHILVLDFISTIFKHVFSSQQVAQFMIQSYPWTPDCLALCTWVAAEDGDADALSMLAADAQSKQQAAQAAQAAASGGSAGSGGTLAGSAAGLGVPTPGAVPSMGIPAGGPGAPMFMPTAFGQAAMQPVGSAAMFGQPGMQPMMIPQPQPVGMMGGGGMGFNPAAALMHMPSPPDGMSLMGQRWLPGTAPSSAQSGMHQPITAAASGCLPVPMGLSHLAGASSGGGGLLADVSGGTPSGPISPHIRTLSTGAK